jgi:hypothetical protein
MMCAAPAYHSTQHWFLLVVVCGFIGSLFFSLYHLCLDVYLKNVNIGWLPTVSVTKKYYFKKSLVSKVATSAVWGMYERIFFFLN